MNAYGKVSFVVLVWVLLACTVVAWNASAHAYRTRQHAYSATILCHGMAEDTAAHVRLVSYTSYPDGPVIVYRCRHAGY